MKKLYIIFALTFLSSCAISNPPSGPGVFYTDVTELVFYNPHAKGLIETEVCSHNYLGFFTYGDSSLYAIKSEAPISTIHSIERTYVSRFFLYAESCLIVKGQNY